MGIDNAVWAEIFKNGIVWSPKGHKCKLPTPVEVREEF